MICRSLFCVLNCIWSFFREVCNCVGLPSSEPPCGSCVCNTIQSKNCRRGLSVQPFPSAYHAFSNSKPKAEWNTVARKYTVACLNCSLNKPRTVVSSVARSRIQLCALPPIPLCCCQQHHKGKWREDLWRILPEEDKKEQVKHGQLWWWVMLDEEKIFLIISLTYGGSVYNTTTQGHPLFFHQKIRLSEIFNWL